MRIIEIYFREDRKKNLEGNQGSKSCFYIYTTRFCWAIFLYFYDQALFDNAFIFFY